MTDWFLYNLLTYFNYSGFTDLKLHLAPLYLDFLIEQHPNGGDAGKVRDGELRKVLSTKYLL